MSTVTGLINPALVTAAVVEFLATEADLSTNNSGNVGIIKVGAYVAPPTPKGQHPAARVDFALGDADPYLVVVPRPLGQLPSGAGGSYNGGGLSLRPTQLLIHALATAGDVAASLAAIAAGRVVELDSDGNYRAPLAMDGQVASTREWAGSAGQDRIGQLHQFTETVNIWVAPT